MAGLAAYGTQLQRGDSAEPEVFTAIANVTTISGPEIERSTIDVTAHDSPNSYMEFLGSFIDPGEASAEINFDPAVHETLMSDIEDVLPRNYKIVLPNAAGEWAFAAVLTGLSNEFPVNDKISAELSWKITGVPVLTTA